jgi:hypothetical protein
MMVATVTKLRTGQSMLGATQLNQLTPARQPFASRLGMNMTVIMRMVLTRFMALPLLLQAQVMLVEVKHPNQKEHQQQTC